MIKTLNQEEFGKVREHEGINDFIALKKRKLFGYTLVSCLEPGCSYDLVKVCTQKKAEKLLDNVCLDYGMKLYEISGVKIDWGIFQIQKDTQPKYLISCGENDLPEITEEVHGAK